MTKLEKNHNQTLQAKEFDIPSGVVEGNKFRFGLGHVLLIVLAIVTLLFMAFISLATSVRVDTYKVVLENPEERVALPAKVKFKSLLQLPLGNRTMVLPGAHTVTVSAEGFETSSVQLNASRVNNNFEVVLSRLSGILQLKITPELGVGLTIDGAELENFNGSELSLAAGRHELVVDAPLHRAATHSVLVFGEGQTQELEITLEPAWAKVQITSAPENAQVSIDGEIVGRSPITMQLEEGVHQLAISADKFKTKNLDFAVTAQQDLVLPPITLLPADGIYELSTVPAKAAIILNGQYQGGSPISLNLKANEVQKIQVYHAGYRLQEQSITLSPDEKKADSIRLKPDTASVRFSVSPADAELLIDGEVRGRGSTTLSLNTLPHQVRVRKSGYVEYQNTIIPTKSSNQVVSVKLLTKEEHFWANVPDSYTSSEGHRMRLFKAPGIVKLGSSRRETGRRSNETVYTARLSKHFYVSEHEVTNKQFRQFKQTHSSGNYKRRSLDSNKHPVVNISWQEAALYCNWLSKKEGLQPFYTTKSGYVSGYTANANGYRLLSEHEWAWLARNKNGETLTYPWVGELKGKPIGNFADKNAEDFIAFTVPNYDDGYKATSPVGRFPANHNGLYDMEGNAAEWVNDWYSPNSELADSNFKVDWLGPPEGEFHTIRGGSWARGHLPQLRLAYRDFGAKGVHDVGFRVARYVGDPE